MITGYTQEQIDAYVWYLVKNPENWWLRG
jgi:hypothetical protein